MKALKVQLSMAEEARDNTRRDLMELHRKLGDSEELREQQRKDSLNIRRQVSAGSIHTAKICIDDTSESQRSPRWPWNSVKVEMKFHLECNPCCPSGQFILCCNRRHRNNVSVSNAAKY